MTRRVAWLILCLTALGLGYAPTWAVADDLSALVGASEALPSDTLEATSGRQMQSDESVLVFPFAEDASSAVVGMRGHNITVGGLEVAAPRPGPAVGSMGFNLVGAATRPNF